MAIFSRLKATIFIIFILVLTILFVARVYYQTTNYFEDNLSFASFEQAEFPNWAYCDRGDEYILQAEDCDQCIATFRDAKGRPLEGQQSLNVEIIQRKELDGAVSRVKFGSLKASANLVKGVLEGPLEVFHENGQVALQCVYKAGLRNGICKSYATSGWLMNEVEYAEGKPTGIFKAHRLDTTLLSEGKGEFCQEYFIDGKTSVKRVFKDKAETWGCTPNSQKIIHDGQYVTRKEYKSFRKDGRLLQVATVLDYASDLPDHPTLYRERVINGNMVRQETSLWDLHVVQDFDQYGILRREIHDRDGVLEGTARWYDAEGRLRLEGSNRAMLRDGLFRWYGADGKMVWMALYAKGELVGQRVFYTVLNWLLFLIVEIILFAAFFPVYVKLREHIKTKVLSYFVVLLFMLGLVAFANYFAFWILISFFS